MNELKNYVGKVVRVHYTYNGNPVAKTGVVYKQEQNGDRVSLGMLLTNGQSWTPTFALKDIEKVSSVRIDEGLRKALVDYCKVKIKQDAFLEQFWKEKGMHESNVRDAIAAVKELSTELTVSDCMNAVAELFK